MEPLTVLVDIARSATKNGLLHALPKNMQVFNEPATVAAKNLPLLELAPVTNLKNIAREDVVIEWD